MNILFFLMETIEVTKEVITLLNNLELFFEDEGEEILVQILGVLVAVGLASIIYLFVYKPLTEKKPEKKESVLPLVTKNENNKHA